MVFDYLRTGIIYIGKKLDYLRANILLNEPSIERIGVENPQLAAYFYYVKLNGSQRFMNAYDRIAKREVASN